MLRYFPMSTIQSNSITIKNPSSFTPASVQISPGGKVHFEKSPDSNKDVNHQTKEVIRDLCTQKNIKKFILYPQTYITFPNGKKFTNKGNEPIVFHETKGCQKYTAALKA
jgi:plastocyanin